ncbi:MAG: hypothetical protein ACXWZB_06565, partial [Gaiellaceae bacterium]
IRAGDLDLATVRPDLPSLTARLDIVEALGSESVAYFRVDAPVVRTEGAVAEDEEAAGDGEGVTAQRPNLVATIPAETGFGLRPGEEIALGFDTAKLHAFDRETGAPLR